MTELENLPEGWTVVKLNELCRIQTGKWDANHAKINGKYRFYTCAFGYSFCDTNRFSGECLILPGNGANVGQVFYYKGEFDAYQRTYVIDKILILPKFLFYHLKLNWKKGTDVKQYGSATNYIRIGNFTEYEVQFPPLPEQHRIVTKLEQLLTELDKGIEQLQTAQQQLKIYRQAVLKWAFEGKLTNTKNIRWGILNEVIESVEYGSSAKSQKQGDIPVLRMGNIQNGKFEWDDLVYTSDKEEIDKYLLKKDDVLFNRTNSPEWVGKTAIYKGGRPAIFAGYLIRVNRKQNVLDPNYLNYFLNSQIAKNHGNKVKSFGVNQSNINGTKLKQYPFPICDINDQKQIVKQIESRLSVCDKIEETIENSLQQSEALRLSIIKKAFEGKLVPQDPNDEPAGELLERIRKMSESGWAGLKDTQDSEQKRKKANSKIKYAKSK